MTKKKELDSKSFAEWDPDSKEPWLLEFEKQPVNDERWACLVTSAIPEEIEEDECIQIYKESVTSGPRKMIKIISMSDVLNLLKGSNNLLKESVSLKGDKKSKGDKVEKTQIKEEKLPSPRLTQILNLVMKYSTFNDFECKLHPNLLAVLLKYMILKMKDDSIREKKINAVKERKIRERNLKAQFIRDLKPYDPNAPKISNEKYESDAPINGPDLYILLTDFFDLFSYPELLRINVPFVAFLKIAYLSDAVRLKKYTGTAQEKLDNTNKEIAIEEFWKNLKETSNSSEKTWILKDIAFMKYTASGHVVRKESYRIAMYNEMCWMQYAAYFIYCHHQKYLRSLCIQKVTLSLEPLDLSKCEVYNKLCDALITGQPLTPLLVLYAMIEQLVAGIPETENTKTEFDNKTIDFFPKRSRSVIEESDISNDSTPNLVPPCLQCRKNVNVCKASFNDNQSTEKSDRTNNSGDKMTKESNDSGNSSTTKSESKFSSQSDYSEESNNFTALIDQVLSERKTEKDNRKEKNFKAPRICFYGDSVTLQTYHCDPRIINPEELLQRFMKSAALMQIWEKYPELPPGEKAYYSFHYNNLLKISKEKEEALRIKIYFALMMKISGATKFYLFAGNEETVSVDTSVIWKINKKNSLEMKHHATRPDRVGADDCFSDFFVDTFMTDLDNHVQRKTAFKIHKLKILEFNNPWKNKNESKTYLSRNRSNVTYKQHNFLNLESLPRTDSFEKSKDFLLPILDCLDITTLSNFDYVNQFERFPKMVERFSFYEKLEPALMIQRLQECRENYNTIYCTYFPPADALAILMHNDSDHRGIFYRMHSESLPTPVALRDFYNYVYPEIRHWVADEIAENAKYICALAEEERAKEKKKDEEYLAKLKSYYRQLNKEERRSFLEQEIDFTSEPEIKENELRELPYKTEPTSQTGETFVVTDIGNLRVETCQKVHEFHSKDGTEMRVIFDGWMYEKAEFLTLVIRRSSLWVQYNLSLRSEETNYTFSLRTASDIIFTFFKEPETSAEVSVPFNVKISWPTGLMIEVIFSAPDSNRYIKQSYIKTYRKGWDIEEEKLRCYLKNGEIVIIKETGNVKILTGSGTIHNVFYGEVPLYETTTMTGEVWEQLIVQSKSPKRRKISTVKIYLGTDCKTREIYYKREDGTSCMLWPNGTLVTNYPDGTKITSTPDFDEDEVSVEWNEDEKLYFLELESKLAGSKSHRASNKCLQSDEFVSVSCTYLMEHPKYSTVYTETKSSLIEIRMVENLRVKTPSDGCYEVQKKNNYLVVNENIVKFDAQCDECGKTSSSVIDFDSNILCRCVDLFENEFIVHKNGETLFHEKITHSEHTPEGGNISEKKNITSCAEKHTANIALKQKCFFLERNLTGIEFIHEDEVAHYCYDLKDDSYFDLNTDDPNAISHTFSSPLSKVGHENWVMNYEKDDSLPTNLKKKDLKDVEVKENRNKLFKYPFPQRQDVEKCENIQPSQKTDMPKVKLVRILKCLPYPGPLQVISDVRKYSEEYQKRAYDKCNTFNRRGVNEFDQVDYVNLRLKKIAVTLSQTLTLYPYVCSQVPSTDKDVHYFGHLINTMEEMNSHFGDEDLLPKCKQIPKRLPRISNFPTIREE